MKKLIIAILLFTAMQSCKKSGQSSNLGSIECKVDGKAVIYQNSNDRVQQANFYKVLPSQEFSTTTQYVVWGNDQSKKNVISLYFDTDNLKTGSYILDYRSGGVKLNTISIDTSHYVVYPEDQINFNVTSITDDRLSGSFSGTMSQINLKTGEIIKQVTITDGKVNNVKTRD